MKKIFLILSSIILSALLVSCGGYRYLDAPPLEFQDIDYGFETHFLQGDPTIAYIDEGSGERTLILVHGLASNAGFWRYNIEELSQNNRVIAIDLPGYGKSDKGDYPYGMAWYAEQIASFINRMDLQNVTYIGHSMGGQIGMTLSINHSQSIDQLVLAAPAGVESFRPGAGNWLANAFTMDGIRKNPESNIREALSWNFYKWDKKWEWMVEERARMAKGEDMPEFSYTVLNSISAMLDEPTSPVLEMVGHPTLIVYGKYDGLIPNRFLNPGFPSAVFEYGHSRIPNSELVEINRAGHMLQIEKPVEFNHAVLTFINSR